MAHQAHYVNGKRVPSCTGVSGKFEDKGGLIFWANAVGLGERDCEDQEPCSKCHRRPGKSHRDAAQKAADVGTLGHAMIEAHVKGIELDVSEFAHLDPEQWKLAEDCFDAFQVWFKAYEVEITETEYSMTSEKYLFGGTCDALGYVHRKFSLFDWKTSKGLYPGNLTQAAGYILLCEDEGFPEIEEIHLVRVAKETAAFEHRMWPRKSFQPAIDFFLAARELYDLEKPLKALLK